MNPYYDHEGITIYHGDCREVLPGLEFRPDLIFADPPYGANKAEWDSEYPSWMEPLLLRSASLVAITPGEWALQRCMLGVGGFYQGLMVGRNLNGMTHGNIGFCNFIPVIVAGERKPRHDGPTSFEFSVSGVQPEHPSPKPIRFMKWIVKRLTEEHETILDPFMGSGTTLRAAKDLGRKAIGIEIEEKYCEIAATRLSQEVLPLTAVNE